MRDIIIGVALIALCLMATTALVLHSRRLIHRISRLKSATCRDILQRRDG
jgi:hypothetical protein